MTIFTSRNILQAYKLARKSRKLKQEVYLFDRNLEQNLINMLNGLKDKKYIHGEYRKIILYDSKKRFIFSPKFQDHILHHLTYAQIYDLLDKKMVHSTFACRRGYGTHKGVLYLQKLINKERKKLKKEGNDEKLYYLKIDFSKYFFSINHNILKQKLRKAIDNEEILYLLNVIIDSYKTDDKFNDLLKDYSYYIEEQNKGLPIGGIISQILANFYLNDLDQFLKHSQKVCFIRYMDDLVILGSKKRLRCVKNNIVNFVEKDKLILNPKKISFNVVDDGVKFIGYRIIKNKIYVGKKIKKSFLRFMDYVDEINGMKYQFSKDDFLRIGGMYYSRIGCFKITTYGEGFLKKRGSTDFLRGGNANNGANDGVFTLNLNRAATNQNNNVGFRCVQ